MPFIPVSAGPQAGLIPGGGEGGETGGTTQNPSGVFESVVALTCRERPSTPPVGKRELSASADPRPQPQPIRHAQQIPSSRPQDSAPLACMGLLGSLDGSRQPTASTQGPAAGRTDEAAAEGPTGVSDQQLPKPTTRRQPSSADMPVSNLPAALPGLARISHQASSRAHTDPRPQQMAGETYEPVQLAPVHRAEAEVPSVTADSPPQLPSVTVDSPPQLPKAWDPWVQAGKSGFGFPLATGSQAGHAGLVQTAPQTSSPGRIFPQAPSRGPADPQPHQRAGEKSVLCSSPPQATEAGSGMRALVAAVRPGGEELAIPQPAAGGEVLSVPSGGDSAGRIPGQRTANASTLAHPTETGAPTISAAPGASKIEGSATAATESPGISTDRAVSTGLGTDRAVSTSQGAPQTGETARPIGYRGQNNDRQALHTAASGNGGGSRPALGVRPKLTTIVGGASVGRAGTSTPAGRIMARIEGDWHHETRSGPGPEPKASRTAASSPHGVRAAAPPQPRGKPIPARGVPEGRGKPIPASGAPEGRRQAGSEPRPSPIPIHSIHPTSGRVTERSGTDPARHRIGQRGQGSPPANEVATRPATPWWLRADDGATARPVEAQIQVDQEVPVRAVARRGSGGFKGEGVGDASARTGGSANARRPGNGGPEGGLSWRPVQGLMDESAPRPSHPAPLDQRAAVAGPERGLAGPNKGMMPPASTAVGAGTPAPTDMLPPKLASVSAQTAYWLRASLRAQRREAVVTLDPPELGRLRIHVRQDGPGMTARITAELPEVEALLRAGAEMIRERLVSQGLRIDQLVIESAPHRSESARSAPSDGSGQQTQTPGDPDTGPQGGRRAPQDSPNPRGHGGAGRDGPESDRRPQTADGAVPPTPRLEPSGRGRRGRLDVRA